MFTEKKPNTVEASPTSKIDVATDVVSKKDGLYRRSSAGTQRIAPPLRILARGRNDQNQNWARWLKIRDADMKRQFLLIRDADLSDTGGRSLIRALTNAGYDLPIDPEDRRAIVNYVRFFPVKARALIVRGNGWLTPTTYVLGDRSFGSTDERCLLDPEIEHDPGRHEQRGTLESWQEAFGPLLKGNPLGMTVVCAAFAGPLLAPLGLDSAGLQLVGPTSIGKSGLLATAAAVGGPPSRGAMISWSTTVNALDDLALSRCDWALIIDETGSAGDGKQEPGDVILSAIYRISGGIEKARKHTGVGPKPAQAQWRVIVLSSSELSLAELAKHSKGRLKGGQVARFVDILADAGAGLGVFNRLPHGVRSPQELTDRLKIAAEQNCGVALACFLKHMTKDLAEDQAAAKKRLKKSFDHFLDRAYVDGFDGEQGRPAKLFAVIYAAAALASRHGILPWSRQEAFRAVLQCYRRVERERATARSEGEHRVLELLGAFWKTRRQEFVNLATGDVKPGAPSLVSAWLKTTKEGRREVIVPTAVFHRQLCGELSERDVVRILTGRHILIRHKSGKSTVQREVPDGGKGRRRFFVLDDRAIRKALKHPD